MVVFDEVVMKKLVTTTSVKLGNFQTAAESNIDYSVLITFVNCWEWEF